MPDETHTTRINDDEIPRGALTISHFLHVRGLLGGVSLDEAVYTDLAERLTEAQ